MSSSSSSPSLSRSVLRRARGFRLDEPGEAKEEEGEKRLPLRGVEGTLEEPLPLGDIMLWRLPRLNVRAAPPIVAEVRLFFLLPAPLSATLSRKPSGMKPPCGPEPLTAADTTLPKKASLSKELPGVSPME